jgi:hypothetical protein
MTIVQLKNAIVGAFRLKYAERLWITPANILEHSRFSGE